jgi:2-oxoacid:acceptor oxidoreductase delta subunit (pyruvate/2-ketoisovalerate family)
VATTIQSLRRPPAGTPMSVSLKSTRELPTGTWRTYRPKYVTQASPCNLDCPAGTDVRAFLAQAAEGDVEGAWRTIREKNPLPGVCGRVCYHPCELNCNRRAVDERVAIHAVERAIADQARLRRLGPDPAPLVLPPRLVAIVGSGPAGLSCAHHLARRGIGTTVFDAMPRPGGMLRYGIPGYRLPRETLDAEVALLNQAGVNFACRTRVGAEIDALGSFDVVFVAVGLWRSRPAGVPGQDLPGVRSGLDFLREVNHRGGAPLAGPVVVIGGGNTALDAARTALRLGGQPTIVYRRSREDMPAHPDEVAQAEAEGIPIVFHAAPLRFLERHGRVAAVEFQRMRPGAPDASGRRRPEPIPGATFLVEAGLALTAIGEEIERESLVEALVLEYGRLAADVWGRTSHRAVFAGGDAATGAGTVVEAIGSGRRAAEAIAGFFEGRDPVAEAQATRVDVSGVNLFYFRPRPRARPTHRSDGGARTFDEVVSGLTWTQAAAEAARCASCGACTRCDNCLVFCPDAAIARDPSGGYTIDFSHCKGCGICAAECPRGALTLVPEDLR